ncbi:HTH_48 domain-containing protein [Trichonephila clavata]|uniref:HTH_48 domain-containing protein n=1 Tax=Trichonephila clavata TaxID=2740835 RepID=A0A8X6FZK3_TRICU|nr:HTH_48 domain-containing protein [Trichonephila clavata]
MEVTGVEQCSYNKIAVLRGSNEMECHNEFVEALGNNVLTYRTVTRWVGKFQQGRVSTSDEQLSGRPFSVQTDLARAVVMDEDRRWMPLELERVSGIEKRTTNASSCQLYVYCVVILLHRESLIALYTAVIN